MPRVNPQTSTKFTPTIILSYQPPSKCHSSLGEDGVNDPFDMLSESSSPQQMAPSTRHRGVRRISGDRVDSTIGLMADTSGGSNGSAHNLAPPNRSASFTLHYSNIPGLNSNLSSVEHHLVGIGAYNGNAWGSLFRLMTCRLSWWR
ncbi:hypothetical protein SK128_024818 [Halocaridina rubra]|uniref:Uncharacterized protein n=1 Tax=Halocaridina rubra TaxID=373956 RepID=A0AAN8XBK8_HALRR